jgi:deoxyribodipyrimidine photo-lyase
MVYIPTREAGLKQMHAFGPSMGKQYASNRNYDNGLTRTNVSKLSPWINAGLIDEQEVIETALDYHSPKAAEKFIFEIFWRIYFKGYLEQRQSIWDSFKSQRNKALQDLRMDTKLQATYNKVMTGSTGIDAFDYWVKELVDTGYLHNHARMWFASIWIFTLKLDWTLGADFFLRHLMDADAASNTLSWRWVGGLHTKGKTYLARQENILKFTAQHPSGPLNAEGLSHQAVPILDQKEHIRHNLNFDKIPSTADSKERFALVLHDEAASHVPLKLVHKPSLVITVTCSQHRSPGKVGFPASSFIENAIKYGGDRAAQAFDCEHIQLTDVPTIGEVLEKSKISKICIPYLTTGWVKDALWPSIKQFEEKGRSLQILSGLNRATWPHSRAGFFGVKKIIPKAILEAGIHSNQMDLF